MVHGLSRDVSSSPLPGTLHDELGASCRGPVYLRGDPNFLDYTKLFNGNVMTTAKAVVCPLDANDVSKVVLFCNQHDLSLSVKAGGYGTAGWAIAGDIVLDLGKLDEVDIETPHPDGSFTSLKDVAASNSKGKQAVASSSASNSGKRRREDDAEPGQYDPASKVEQFLHGPQVSRLDGTGPPPTVRRRFDHSSQTKVPPVSLPVESDGVSGTVDPPTSTEPTPATTFLPPPSPPVIIHEPTKPPPAPSNRSSADPFGYLDHPSNFPPVPPPAAVQSFNNPHAMLNLWGTANESPLLTDSPGPFASMTIFTQLEPIYPHVFVTFGSGMRQKEIDTYSAKNPVEARYPNGSAGSIPYHIPFAAHPTGSSIMLLGGFGFLGRLHGLSVDNLVEVEMVLADGRIVIISAKDYPDLWWAIRGAGPAFGIATRYKAKAYPVPVVFAGNLIYRFNKATAPSLLKHFRDCVKGAPRELYANILLTAGPAGKDSLMVVQMCYIGPREKGQEYLAALSSWDGEQCLLNEVDEKSFLHQQDSVAQVLRGKAGRQWFIRSALISSLPDNIINETVMQFSDTPMGCTWLFELAGGAIADYDETCIPKSQREAPFTVAALHQWDMNVNDDRCIESAEVWIAETLRSVHIGGPYPSFLGRHESPSRVKACFGANWERLQELKRLYDPKNLFRHNFWPLNELGEEVDPRTHEPPTPQSFD